MKKILILSLAFLIAFGAKAQTSLTLYNTLGPGSITSDTVTNTGTGILQADASRFSGNVTSVQCTVAKTSGTVAGTLSLYGSNDGSNYAIISDSVYTATNVASQSFIWILSGSPVKHYRVSYTGSGTMVAKISGAMWINKAR